MRRDRNYAAISAYLSEDGDEFQLVIQTSDGSKLNRQKIIDLIGDYLIRDDDGYFENES